jgi:hypothetical protein
MVKADINKWTPTRPHYQTPESNYQPNLANASSAADCWPCLLDPLPTNPTNFEQYTRQRYALYCGRGLLRQGCVELYPGEFLQVRLCIHAANPEYIF